MKKVLIVIGIISVVGLMIALNLNKSQSDSDGGISFGGSKAQEVEAVRIQKGSLSSSVIITGTVEEVIKKDLVATSMMEITSVLVEEGDFVNEGEALFTIDVSSLEDELVQLKLNRDIQSLQIEKIESVSTSSSSTGAKVALELAKINLASAKNFYDNQLVSLEKNKALFEEGIISQSELDGLSKSIDDAKSQVDIATLNLERSESDLAQIYNANSSSTKSLEFDIQIQLKNLESMDLNIAKVEKQIQESIDATKAPISGVVTMAYIETGDMVMSSSPLFQIMDMKNLMIKANVREYDIRNMKIGQHVKITGDAIDDETNVSGELSYISPVASDTIINGRATTGIEIHMNIKEGLDYLKPGYTTDCEITTKSIEDVVVGSYELFKEDKDNNKMVFVIKDGVLEKRMVETGITSDFEAEIISGLSAGELVVVNPSLILKEGMKVTVTNDLEEVGE